MRSSLVAAALMASLSSGLTFTVSPERPAVRTDTVRPVNTQRKKRAMARSSSIYSYLGSPMMYATVSGKPGTVAQAKRAATKKRNKR